MITCIAIDDEPLALQQICSYVNKVTFLNLTGSFTSSMKALSYLQNNEVDLIFIDINMPKLSGMELVKSLFNPPKVIFITAYREYAVEGFQVDAADYLVKPLSFTKFLKAIEKTRQRYFSTPEKKEVIQLQEEFLFLKSEYKIVRTKLDDISYIEGMRDYLRVHLDNKKSIMSRLGMKDILEHLPKNKFMRIHRSYIVNLNRIITIERNRVVMGKDIYLPISEQYKNVFHKFLEDNSL